MENNIEIYESEKKFVINLMKPVIKFNILVFLILPPICAIGVPALWVISALWMSIGFWSISFIPVMYIIISLLKKFEVKASIQICVFSIITVVCYIFLFLFKIISIEVLTVMLVIFVFTGVIMLPFIISSIFAFKSLIKGKITLERRIASGEVQIIQSGKRNVIKIGNYRLSDLLIIKKINKELYYKVNEVLERECGKKITVELALGLKGFLKYKNFLLKIGDWNVYENN